MTDIATLRYLFQSEDLGQNKVMMEMIPTSPKSYVNAKASNTQQILHLWQFTFLPFHTFSCSPHYFISIPFPLFTF